MSDDTLKNLPIKLADKAYDDLRPVVTKAVGSVVYVLELADKLIHAPETAIRKIPDVYGKCCEAYRRFREEIPEEFQQEPQSSIAYSVVQSIPGADEAGEIQEMFAKLLASASDSRRSKNVSAKSIGGFKDGILRHRRARNLRESRHIRFASDQPKRLNCRFADTFLETVFKWFDSRLRGVAEVMDCGADVLVDWPLPTAQQGL